MIETKELTKLFGQKTAVDHISFSVEKGEILGFLGPNAAGKSTTMRMITGFLPPTSGTAIVGGDASDGTIAAASIVAKVHRDAIMRHLDSRYPGYGFGRHMGYGTPQHLEVLRRLGPSPVHRRSFAPVARAAAR